MTKQQKIEGGLDLSRRAFLVGAGAAGLIGLIAGVLVVEAAFFVERRLLIDDPVGAIAELIHAAPLAAGRARQSH